MENEKVEQLQKKFNKLYFDTTKHCGDIEKWIKSGNRKQGDIRRSLNRLTKKYKSLCDLREELRRNNITEQKALNHISNQKNQVDLAQIRDKMETLYNLAGLRKPIKSMYGNEVELITDIPIGTGVEIKSQIESIYSDDIELINDIIDDRPNYLKRSEERSLKVKIKQKFGKIKEKIEDKVSNFKNSNKKKTKSKGSFKKRVVALGMALTMGLFGSATAGENISKSDDAKNNKSYTDINPEKNDFKESIYIQALENTQETKTTVGAIENTENTKSVQKSTESVTENSERQESKQEMGKEDEEDIFLVRANTEYTEVSDGSGKSGSFSKDTKVKDYNWALVETREDGSKQIIAVTEKGENLKEFAEKNGKDYKKLEEYIENNENIQECVSIQSEDGKTLYGWLSSDELEEVEVEKDAEVENMEEIER